jgi:hydroxyacylglutathione hydrolase
MLTISAVPAFQDNYIWVFHQEGSNLACVVDPGTAEPVLRHLETAGLQLEAILLTHHHADHIGGVADLLKLKPVKVFGPASSRIPWVNQAVQEGSNIDVAGVSLRVLEVPGHTLEHIAYFSGEAVTTQGPVLFCGDTLFAAGCGRMFEGTPPMMHASLLKLAQLPPATQVYCAHEYTLSNLRFAQRVMPGNHAVVDRIARETAKRARNEPTLPSSIELELATNPFLCCHDSTVQASVSEEMPGTNLLDAASVFGALRGWKDRF